MSLPDHLRSRLALPLICPPMFLVSGPELVIAACTSGVMAGLPRPNARSDAEFESWLVAIREAREAHEDATGLGAAPFAVNMSTRLEAAEMDALLDVGVRHGAEVVISAAGNPTTLVERAHDRGLLVFHDVTNVRFAEKAIAAGVDGLVCIGAGGGGHSGMMSPLALVPKVRSMFDGTIIAAGAVSTGSAVRALEVLGADLVYAGTRFIATRESLAPEGYKQMLVSSTASDLYYLTTPLGAPANWMGPSLTAAGIDLDAVATAHGDIRHGTLPGDVRAWADVWSAGQGVELIDDVPPVRELVERFTAEYARAAQTPAFDTAAAVAR